MMNKNDRKGDKHNIHNSIANETKGYYFEAYSELDAHASMIRDYHRTMAYKRAIEMNKHLFKDKIVLDIGCGLGILSLFAAKAGARTVIGVDASDVAINAQEIAKANNFSNIIIINSKVEDITELPLDIKQVDIIISEWMGLCLYHESMLSTVVYARNKWLKPNGLLFPNKVRLYLAVIDDREKINRVEGWNSVHGFDLSALKEIAYGEATLASVDEAKVASNHCLINELHLKSAPIDFSFTSNYSLVMERDANIVGFITYFEVIFSKCHTKITLSTSPSAPLTHWGQTIFRFDESMWLNKGNEITGTFSLEPYKFNFRDLFIRIKVQATQGCTIYCFTRSYVLR